MVSVQDVVDYFLYPAREGYTVTKTAVYALVLVVAVFAIFKLLKKLKIKIDEKLVLAISPYVLLGGMIRVVQDIGIIDSPIFVTPGIYFLIFSIVISAIVVSVFAERKFKIPYYKPVFIIGLLAVSFLIPVFRFVNVQGAILILIFFLPWVIVFYKLRWSGQNKLVTLVQMLDATATYVATNFFNYSEQHVFPTFLIGMFSPISFVFVKMIVIVLTLVAIDRFVDKEFGVYLKLVIAILGAAPASRDLTTLLTLSNAPLT